ARRHLAGLLSLMGETGEAARHYEELLRREPGEADAIVGLAHCDHDQHRLDEARRLLDGLLAEQPDHVPALVERGRLALRLGQPAAAAEWFGRATERAPYDREALRLRYQSLRAQRRDSAAEESLARLNQLEAE